jgi:hypothetical protein
MDNKWLDDARVENVIAADLLDIIGDRFVLVRTVAGYTFEVRDGRQYDCQTAIADVTWPADAQPAQPNPTGTCPSVLGIGRWWRWGGFRRRVWLCES